jgi:hypothetical protein
MLEIARFYGMVIQMFFRKTTAVGVRNICFILLMR